MAIKSQHGFWKITEGYIKQLFNKNGKCIEQQFVASDNCQYLDYANNVIDPPDYEQYQQYTIKVQRK